VTGDHGEGLGEHGETAHGVFAYESTLRIPLIIAEIGGAASASSGALAEGRAGAGEVSSVAARHIDILPTILDAVGQAVPSDLPGRTLLPFEERTAGAPARTTYFEALTGMLNHGWAPLTGVLVGRDKLIDLPIVERYDLTGDPSERLNLAGRLPERDRMLAVALSGFKPAAPGRRLAENPETIARLRALGYVSAEAPAKPLYSEADDPKRLIELDTAIHRAIDAGIEGRVEDAAQICRQVIERRPDMAFPYRRLALIEWERGNAAGAIAVLRQAVAHGVTDSRALTQLGDYLAEAGHMAEGIRILEPLARNPAADPDTVNAHAIALARSGRTDDARRGFERLIELLPTSSAPLENLGVLALGQGDLTSAKKYFDRAVVVEPSSSRAQAGVGTTAIQSGDRPGAYAAWTRAVELDPTNYDALYNLGVSLARDGRMDAARPYLEQFLRSAPPALHAGELREVSRLLATPLR
jgi:Flp pilus assembly protein TadD